MYSFVVVVVVVFFLGGRGVGWEGGGGGGGGGGLKVTGLKERGTRGNAVVMQWMMQ